MVFIAAVLSVDLVARGMLRRLSDCVLASASTGSTTATAYTVIVMQRCCVWLAASAALPVRRWLIGGGGWL